MKTDIYGEEFAGDFIEHFGVKGMKWGERRAQRKARDDRTEAARENVRIERIALSKQKMRMQKARGALALARETSKYEEQRLSFLNNPDRATAYTMTRGDEMASLITLGPLGPLLVSGLNLAGQQTVKKRQLSGYYDRRAGF